MDQKVHKDGVVVGEGVCVVVDVFNYSRGEVSRRVDPFPGKPVQFQ